MNSNYRIEGSLALQNKSLWAFTRRLLRAGSAHSAKSTPIKSEGMLCRKMLSAPRFPGLLFLFGGFLAGLFG